MNPNESGGAKPRRGCKVLAFVSGKGGPGKTVSVTSLAYVLKKTGQRVLLIDADFMTRGSSYFLIGDAAESRVLDIEPESALYPIMRASPIDIDNARPALVRRAEGDEYDIFFADTDLFKGGLLDAEHTRFLSPEVLYSGLKALCDRFRSEYDYILLDTHGGYDQFSAIPALVADGYVVVLEADKLSINQTRTFLNSIESYDPSHSGADGEGPKRRLEGFISNKWVYPVEDDTILQHLKDLFGGIPFGNIPWDITVVLDYGNKFMPLERHAGSDYAYYSIQALSKVLGPNLNWDAEAQERFLEFESSHRVKWRLGRALHIGRVVLLSTGSVALALSAVTFVAYQAGHFLATLQLPLALILIFLLSTGILATDATFRGLSERPGNDRRKTVSLQTLRWPATTLVACVFVATGYLMVTIVPAKLNNQGLLARIQSDQQVISQQSSDLIQIRSQNAEKQTQLQLANVDLEAANQKSTILSKQATDLLVQMQSLSSQLNQAKQSAANSANLLCVTPQASQQPSKLAQGKNSYISEFQPKDPGNSGATTSNCVSCCSAIEPIKLRLQRVPESVLRGNRISGDSPVYPELAKAAHVQGTVIFNAIISESGTVEELQLLSGQPMLQKAACDAVKTWRFKPYAMDGATIEVQSTISVVFTIGT